jgi:hypothetical protein
MTMREAKLEDQVEQMKKQISLLSMALLEVKKDVAHLTLHNLAIYKDIDENSNNRV